MINLLPPTEKENLQTQEKYRLLLIWLCLVLFFFIALSLILFSLNIYLAGENKSQEISVAAETSQFQNSPIQKMETEIDSLNKDLAKLESFYKSQAKFAGFLEKISEIVPKGMYLTSFSLDENKVSLVGYAVSRETLFEFKKRLEGEPIFEEVYLPPASWVTPANFSATFKLKI